MGKLFNSERVGAVSIGSEERVFGSSLKCRKAIRIAMIQEPNQRLSDTR